MARKPNRFTIYDMMEQKGVFEANPNNAGARDETGENLYQGPTQFPQMFYHPQGQEYVAQAGEIVVTPLGPREVNKQMALVSQVAANEAEAKALRAAGWHDHPRKALAAAGKAEAMPRDPSETIAELQAEITRLQAEKNEVSASILAGQSQRGRTGATGGLMSAAALAGKDH